MTTCVSDEQAQALPSRRETYGVAAALKVPEVARQSQLRHAMRFDGYTQQDENFHLEHWPVVYHGQCWCPNNHLSAHILSPSGPTCTARDCA